MRNIIGIYKRDIKSIFKNYAALITIIVLCILPSLYAWFNIAASWDPYSEKATSKIKIGVVSEDIGTVLNGKEINLGDEVINELKNNKLLGWQFVSFKEAEEKLYMGEYYATIIIPESFSEDMTSIVTSEIKKADIIYTVNEKINAIAPKITIKGASGIEENVRNAFVETVSSTLLNVTKDIGIEIENAKPKISNVYNLLLEVQGRFSNINDIVDTAYDGVTQLKSISKKISDDIPLVEQTIINSQNLAGEVKNFITSSKSSLSDLAPTIKEDIRLINEISSDISNYIDTFLEAVDNVNEEAPEILDNLIQKVDNLNNITTSVLKVLEALNKLNPNLNDVIANIQNLKTNIESLKVTLNTLSNIINEGNVPDMTLINNVKTFSDRINSISGELYSTFDTTIVPKINSLLDQSYLVAENALEVLQEAQDKLPDVTNLLNTAYEGADKGIEEIEFAKSKLPMAEEIINTLVEKMSAINQDAGLDEVLDVLRDDVAERSDFLTNPINLVENQIFSMGNYGSAMTPFYTTLSLWTGVLFLVSLLNVDPHEEEDEEYSWDLIHFKSYERYFGKQLLFLTLTIIQALIVSIGDLYLLKTYCLNPLGFILTSVLTSILFTLIVYTACSVFGNAGKVICIVLLVFQIGGSGGTFPIELTPGFFQKIHPYLPFTYTISLMREMIGGIVRSTVITDLSVIFGIIISSVVVGSVLKRPINKITDKFAHKFKESKLGE